MNVYEIVTEKIINCLENGVIPWKKNWKEVNFANYVSQKPYQGINKLLLQSQMITKDKIYKSPFWLTWNQIQDLKGSVLKNEKSSIIVFFNTTKVDVLPSKPFIKSFSCILSCSASLKLSLANEINSVTPNPIPNAAPTFNKPSFIVPKALE